MAKASTNEGGYFPWNLFLKHPETIGYGKFGTVFKVTAMADGKVYALKQTHYPPIGKDFERCKDEIITISRLENPYIVRYNTSFQDHKGKIYIQMELCGKDLKVCLDDSNLTLNIIRPQARRLLDQLLGGIDYIHSQGLIHRDLKPSNIFVVINEGVLDLKIGDFGLASFKDDEMSSFTGAPLYRAPEQESNEYDNRVDMFTLGIVLFEVLKKKYGCSVNWKEYIWKLRKDAKGTLEEFEPYEPKGWKQLISALLGRDPKGRPGAKFLLANLNSLLSEDKAKVAFIPETNIPGNRNSMALGDTAKSFKKGKPKICTIVNRYRDAYLDPEPDAYLEQYEPDAYLDPEPYSWQDNLHEPDEERYSWQDNLHEPDEERYSWQDNLHEPDEERYSWQDNLHEPDEERYSWQDNLHEPDAEPDSWLDLHEGDAYL